MFKKTMQFDDLDGNAVTQVFYFNYNKKEIAELLEFGGLEEKLALLTQPVEESGLTQQQNNQQAYDIFQELIANAYGKKGEDNVTFLKTPALKEYWTSHVAFVEMIFEFLENTQLAAEFIERCLPAKMVDAAKAEMQRENAGKLSSETLGEMVEEAARRQKDPATRIEPGPEAAKAVIGEDPTIAAIAKNLVEDGPVPVRPVGDDGEEPAVKPEDMTEADIMALDDVAFFKLDVKNLSKEGLMAAFKRKNA